MFLLLSCVIVLHTEGDSPGIANPQHGVLRLFLGDVFRTLGFLLLLLFLPGSLVVCAGPGCAVWLGAPLWLRPGAAEGGGRGDV